jgi:hypothetical protein
LWTQDSAEIFIGPEDASRVLHLGVSAGGATYDALAVGKDPEATAWGGPWSLAVAANAEGLAFELAIPWSTLTEAGIDKQSLAINLLVNQHDKVERTQVERPRDRIIGEAIVSLGWSGRERCTHLVPLGLGTPKPVAERSYTVRLHFVEPNKSAEPGQRVFDVKIQGRTALESLDIARDIGVLRALSREIEHIQARDTLTLEFLPAVQTLSSETAPIICAIEFREET